MLSHLFSITITLFIIMNPVGNIPLYSKVLKNFEEDKKRSIIIRELFIALSIMILSVLWDNTFLSCSWWWNLAY